MRLQLKGYLEVHGYPQRSCKNPECLFKTEELFDIRILINQVGFMDHDERRKTLYCVDISEVQISEKRMFRNRGFIMIWPEQKTVPVNIRVSRS